MSSVFIWAQRDSIPLGTSYKEDQFYLGISYNRLNNQPVGVSGSGFSYGFALGGIKDISISKQGNWALGIGLGYAFESFNHGLQITSANGVDQFSTDNVLDSNTMSLHALEMPLEIRWRNSNAQKYKFWRVYPGFKLSYNIRNSFSSVSNGISAKAKNIDSFRNFQYGPSLSVGYDAVNLHVYYALTPLFENATLQGQTIDTRILQIGLIIYIL